LSESINYFEKCVLFVIYQTSESSEGKFRLRMKESYFQSLMMLYSTPWNN